MDKNRLRILYVSHRYHTNQIPIMEGWQAYGAKVFFWASYEGIGEVHDAVDFRLFKPSWVTKLYNKYANWRYSPAIAEHKKSDFFIPHFIDTVKNLKRIEPDLIVLRDFNFRTAIVSLACKFCHFKNVIMYTQLPLYGFEHNRNRIINAIASLIFPKVCFTPILFFGENRHSKIIYDCKFTPRWFVPLVYGIKDSNRTFERQKGKIRILDVGKYRDYKNHFFLVDAISQIADKNKLELTIIGQLSNESERLYYDELENYIMEKGLSSIITLRGNVPYKEMVEIYKSHDILVVPSKNEPAAMVIVEGLANGLCVLGSMNCGLSSYLDEYNCGKVFNVKTTTQLVEQLTEFIEHPELIEEYGHRGIKTITEKCSFKNYLLCMNELTKKEFGLTLTD